MERSRKLYRLPISDIEKPHTASRTEIDVFSPEEVMALVRAADSERDAAIYLTAAQGGHLDGSALSKRCRAALERAALSTP